MSCPYPGGHIGSRCSGSFIAIAKSNDLFIHPSPRRIPRFCAGRVQKSRVPDVKRLDSGFRRNDGVRLPPIGQNFWQWYRCHGRGPWQVRGLLRFHWRASTYSRLPGSARKDAGLLKIARQPSTLEFVSEGRSSGEAFPGGARERGKTIP